MHSYIRRISSFIGIIALLTVISLLVFQRHQNTGFFNWRSKMWGDAVGYYIYSPALFIYDFDASKLPEKITEKTGEGFVINENGKIITRYSCGVAILQAPVFLVVHWIAGLTGQEQDGFSGIYHLVTSFAAILYSFLGILLLWRFLLYYFNKWITFWAILTVFTGTNLLYYTIDATGMSHIYSFFLFALLLVLSKLYFSGNETKGTKYFILISLVSSLIVLIRPTNLAFIGLVFLLDVRSGNGFITRLRQVFTPLNIFILVISVFLVFLPQMIYWKYSFGTILTDSYAGYGFTNWTSPKIKEFLFSTNNGLFPYNPLYFVMLTALGFMIVKREINGWFILSVFIGLIYIFSSWFIFSFGCGFGSRNFVEYTTIFALPLGYFYQNFLKRSIIKWLIVIPVIVIAVYVNTRLTVSYNKCFLEGDWDWEEYSYLLKLKKYDQVFVFNPVEELDCHKEFSDPVRIAMDTISRVNFRRAIVELDTKIFDNDNNAHMIFQIATPDTTIYWNGIKIIDQFKENELGAMKRVTFDYWLPRRYTINSEISSFVWNMNKDSLQVSRIKIHLE